MSLSIFYDSQCPLCVMEMRSLKARDLNGLISLEDIWQEDFSQRFPHIDPAAANQILHAIDDKGRLLLGLDVTAEAWALVGINRYRILRWPIVKFLADFLYRCFARHRYSFSKLLTGQARLCSSDSCSVSPKTKSHGDSS